MDTQDHEPEGTKIPANSRGDLSKKKKGRNLTCFALDVAGKEGEDLGGGRSGGWNQKVGESPKASFGWGSETVRESRAWHIRMASDLKDEYGNGFWE